MFELQNLLIADFMNNISFIEILPQILLFIVLVVIGWAIIRFTPQLIAKTLKWAKFETFAEKTNLNNTFSKAGFSITPLEVVSKVLYWMILLIFFVAVTDYLHLDIVTNLTERLITYLPQLFSGILILIIGIYFAVLLRDIIAATTNSLGIGGGNLISGTIFYFLVLLIGLTALDQIGIDTTNITDNLNLILGAILLSASISYGFASKGILENILATFFSRNTFEVGQEVKIDDIQGKIIKIDTICVTIQTLEEKIVIPSKQLTDRKIHIIDNSWEQEN